MNGKKISKILDFKKKKAAREAGAAKRQTAILPNRLMIPVKMLKSMKSS